MKTTVKGIAAAVAATVLATLGATTPALAETAHVRAAHPVVAAHRVSSADAIADAVRAEASPGARSRGPGGTSTRAATPTS